ncbi:DMT family transporter [Nocardioides sp. Soil777]|uniref:DMT family transporter n=1 Tax=Nocardioides sp. Soil777 TaxID=1736409 RepID=UPI000AA7BF1C|nr:EamA family transporter [Nocardioides sp. Soil777]
MEKILAHRFGLVLLTAVAPAAWGTTYIVTEQLLPPDRPLFGALVRALPIGLVMLAWRRRLPRGDWWWKAAVMGLCNIGAFFPLIFLAAYHLPGGLAATIQATAPLAVMALAWPLIGERPARVRVGAALMGLVGVTLLVLRNPDGVTALGLAGALGSVLVSALGFVLMKRWTPPVDMLTLVSWQLVVGGLALLPLALVLEGAPPAIDLEAALGYTWIAVVGTGLAYVCWFTGLRAMPAGAVSLIGLVNPVVGTALGVVVAAEAFGWVQALGMALVLGGVLLGQRTTRRRRTSPPRHAPRPRAAQRPRVASRPREALRPLEAPRPAAEPVAAKMGG